MELINGNGTVPAATSGYTTHAIMSSTNAAPIAVTFTGSHGFNEGDTIEVEGHATNTAANGQWQVHITGAATLQLVGSTGNGVGGATGYAVDYSLNPLIQVGDDGDGASALNLNTPYEGLFNFVPYLYRRVGNYRLYDVKSLTGGTLFTTTATTALNSSTWTDLGITPLAGNRYVQQNDILRFGFFSTVSSTGSAPTVAVAFGLNVNGGGASVLATSALGFNPFASSVIAPMTLAFDLVYPVPGIALPYAISIMGLSASATPSITLSGPWQLQIRHYRSNV